MSHGKCSDGEHEVDCIVVRDQVVGPEKLICPECKILRVRADARKTIEEIEKKAKVIRDARAELIPLFGPGEKGRKQKPEALLNFKKHNDPDAGEFWLATSTLGPEGVAEGLVYRIQKQLTVSPTTQQSVVMFVLCGDPETLPAESDRVWTDLASAMEFCEQLERAAVEAAGKAKLNEVAEKARVESEAEDAARGEEEAAKV